MLKLKCAWGGGVGAVGSYRRQQARMGCMNCCCSSGACRGSGRGWIHAVCQVGSDVGIAFVAKVFADEINLGYMLVYEASEDAVQSVAAGAFGCATRLNDFREPVR